VISGSSITGLVTLSDLQKLPVRAALFALVTGFEMAMAELIRKRLGENDGWLLFLNATRQTRLRQEIANSKREDGFVDALLFTQFCDKAEIIRKASLLSRSKREVETLLNKIQALRDAIAHANEYAASPEEAKHVCRVVRSLLALKTEILSA
jgi:hypothetical protein